MWNWSVYAINSLYHMKIWDDISVQKYEEKIVSYRHGGCLRTGC